MPREREADPGVVASSFERAVAHQRSPLATTVPLQRVDPGAGVAFRNAVLTGWHFNLTSTVIDAGRLALADWLSSSVFRVDPISEEDFEIEFPDLVQAGVPWSEGMSRARAELHRDIVQRDRRLEAWALLGESHQSGLRSAAGFGGTLLGSMAGPLDLVTAYWTPLGLGIVKPVKGNLAQTLPRGHRFMRGFEAGGRGGIYDNMAWEAFIAPTQRHYLHRDYTFEDSVASVLIGGLIAGGTLHGGMSALPRSLSNQEYVTARSMAMMGAVRSTDPQQINKAIVSVLRQDPHAYAEMRNHTILRDMLERGGPRNKDEYLKFFEAFQGASRVAVDMERIGVPHRPVTSSTLEAKRMYRTMEAFDKELYDQLIATNTRFRQARDFRRVSPQELEALKGIARDHNYRLFAWEEPELDLHIYASPRSRETMAMWGQVMNTRSRRLGDVEFMRDMRSQRMSGNISSAQLRRNLIAKRRELERENQFSKMSKKVFNVKVRYLDANFAKEHGILGAVSAKHPDTIYVSRTSLDEETVSIFGHEFAHLLRRHNPDVWRRVVEAMNDENNRTLFQNELTRMHEQFASNQAWKSLPDGMRVDEAHANLFGKLMQNPEFWRALARKNPSAFHAVLSYMKRLVSKLDAFLGTQRRLLSSALKSLTKQREGAVAGTHIQHLDDKITGVQIKLREMERLEDLSRLVGRVLAEHDPRGLVRPRDPHGLSFDAFYGDAQMRFAEHLRVKFREGIDPESVKHIEEFADEVISEHGVLRSTATDSPLHLMAVIDNEPHPNFYLGAMFRKRGFFGGELSENIRVLYHAFRADKLYRESQQVEEAVKRRRWAVLRRKVEEVEAELKKPNLRRWMVERLKAERDVALEEISDLSFVRTPFLRRVREGLLENGAIDRMIESGLFEGITETGEQARAQARALLVEKADSVPLIKAFQNENGQWEVYSTRNQEFDRVVEDVRVRALQDLEDSVQIEQRRGPLPETVEEMDQYAATRNRKTYTEARSRWDKAHERFMSAIRTHRSPSHPDVVRARREFDRAGEALEKVHVNMRINWSYIYRQIPEQLTVDESHIFSEMGPGSVVYSPAAHHVRIRKKSDDWYKEGTSLTRKQMDLLRTLVENFGMPRTLEIIEASLSQRHPHRGRMAVIRGPSGSEKITVGNEFVKIGENTYWTGLMGRYLHQTRGFDQIENILDFLVGYHRFIEDEINRLKEEASPSDSSIANLEYTRDEFVALFHDQIVEADPEFLELGRPGAGESMNVERLLVQVGTVTDIPQLRNDAIDGFSQLINAIRDAAETMPDAAGRAEVDYVTARHEFINQTLDEQGASAPRDVSDKPVGEVIKTAPVMDRSVGIEDRVRSDLHRVWDYVRSFVDDPEIGQLGRHLLAEMHARRARAGDNLDRWTELQEDLDDVFPLLKLVSARQPFRDIRAELTEARKAPLDTIENHLPDDLVAWLNDRGERTPDGMAEQRTPVPEESLFRTDRVEAEQLERISRNVAGGLRRFDRFITLIEERPQVLLEAVLEWGETDLRQTYIPADNLPSRHKKDPLENATFMSPEMLEAATRMQRERDVGRFRQVEDDALDRPGGEEMTPVELEDDVRISNVEEFHIDPDLQFMLREPGDSSSPLKDSRDMMPNNPGALPRVRRQRYHDQAQQVKEPTTVDLETRAQDGWKRLHSIGLLPSEAIQSKETVMRWVFDRIKELPDSDAGRLARIKYQKLATGLVAETRAQRAFIELEGIVASENRRAVYKALQKNNKIKALFTDIDERGIKVINTKRLREFAQEYYVADVMHGGDRVAALEHMREELSFEAARKHHEAVRTVELMEKYQDLYVREGWRGMLSHIDGKFRTREARGEGLSIEHAARRQASEDLGVLVDVLNEHELLALWKDKNSGFADGVVRYLEDGRPADAPDDVKAVGDVLHDVFLNQVDRFNRNGAGIRLREGYAGKHMHDPLEIARRGEEEWVRDMMDYVDWEQTRIAQGDIQMNHLPDGQVRPFDPKTYLINLYRQFTEGDLRLDAAQGMSDFALTARGAGVSKHRMIIFKPGAYTNYRRSWSNSHPGADLISQIHNQALGNVFMEAMGPNPTFVRNFIREMGNMNRRNLVDKENARRPGEAPRPSVLADVNEAASRRLFDMVWNYTSGVTNVPVNQKMQSWGTMGRLYANIVYMAYASITAMTDVATTASTMHYMGIPLGRAEPMLIKAIANSAMRRARLLTRTDSAANRVAEAILNGEGAGLSAITNSVARRFGGEWSGEGLVKRLNDAVFSLNGMNAWVNIIQDSLVNVQTVWLADMAVSSRLTDQQLRVLNRYGISPEEIRSLDSSIVGPVPGLGDDLRIFPDSISDSRLRRRVSIMMDDLMRQGMIEPSFTDEALIRMGFNPGTVSGESTRTILQYKVFPIALASKTYRRIALGYGDGLVKGWGRLGFNNTRVELASFITASLFMGWLTLNIKEFLRGREPVFFLNRDGYSWANMQRILVQSGAAGPVQDFIGRSAIGATVDFALGPTGTTGKRAAETALAFTDAPKGRYQAINFTRDMIPLANLPILQEGSRSLLAWMMADAYGTHYEIRNRFYSHHYGQRRLSEAATDPFRTDDDD